MNARLKLIENTDIPQLYATEHIAMEDKIACRKLYSPVINWTWYVIEFDGIDQCFGLVKGFETEFGYFSLTELSGIRTVDGYHVMADEDFTPCRIAELLK